jgi:hypothetical protein
MLVSSLSSDEMSNKMNTFQIIDNRNHALYMRSLQREKGLRQKHKF